jgi:O-antigen ligase
MEVRVMMDMIKGSVIVSFLLKLYTVFSVSWQESRLKRLCGFAGESVTGNLAKAYVNKQPFYLNSITYRVITGIFGLFDRLFGKLHSLFKGNIRRVFSAAWKNSLIYRSFTSGTVLSESICGRAAVSFVSWLAVRKYDLLIFVLAAFGVIDVVLRKISGTLGSVWDEMFLMILIIMCVFKWIADRKDYRLKTSPMDTPLFVFIGVMIFCLIVNSPDFSISLEGFRAIVQYMLWYFVVIQLIKGENSAKAVTGFFVVVAAALAVYGVYQYAAGVEMPAGWTDHNEATLRTRVYAIFTSPNVFGSLLTLAAPMSVSMIMISRKKAAKAAFSVMTLFIAASLAFTFSRGAWIGFIVAVGVYVLIKDKRLIIPCIIAAVLVVICVPSIGGRISYMLSSEYIESSLRGGRLVRWITGLKIFADYPVLGVGLGQFGGAVAMNNDIKFIVDNQVTEAFYMDNYFLKTALESGIVGLAAFVGLMYSVFINGIRTVRMASTNVSKELSTGILAGLCGVIVHNFVENIFEVPMMTSLFWMFVAVLMGIWFYEHNGSEAFQR